jgi:hypothetical protein
VVQEVQKKADAPPRLLHRAQDSRVLSVAGGQILAPGPSLWSRMTARPGAQ